MPRIPAVCNECRWPFPSEFVVEGRLTALSEFNEVPGECPKCGGKGQLSSEALSCLEGLLRVRREKPALAAELRLLRAALRDAPDDKLYLEQLGPSFPSVWDPYLATILREQTGASPAQARALLVDVLTFVNSV